MSGVTRAVRSTRQRVAVSALLDRLDDFRSAQEIHEELRRAGDGIGLTTVYRTLQTLADGGEVDVLRTASGESVYRRCASDEHHHHLVCRRCGAAVEIEGPAVESWTQAVAERHGFTDLSHTVEIFGLCGDCSASPVKASPVKASPVEASPVEASPVEASQNDTSRRAEAR